MLVYDLYVMNKGSSSNPGTNIPVKKIFFCNNSASIDSKSIEEYLTDDTEVKFNAQRILSMPLNTSPRLGLPNKVTGKNQPSPYVIFYGNMSNKKSGTIFEVECRGAKNTGEYKAMLDLMSNKKEFSLPVNVKLKIDRKNYFVGGKSLFEHYVECGILTPDSELPFTVFQKICEEFFSFVQKDWNQDINGSKMKFWLYILPTEEPVEYKDDVSWDNSQKIGIDSFGNEFSRYPSKPTQNAKFLSFDDPAFTLNLTKREEFYKSLHIGNESHERINLPSNREFKISGLFWIFADITDTSYKFKENRTGIYGQLLSNYKELSDKAGDPYEAKSQMKILCLKRTQAKIEVLLDENLTMDEMKNIFSRLEKENLPPLVLELLLQNKRNNKVWSYYLDTVRALIGRKNIDRSWLLNILTNMLREKLFNWLDRPSEAKDFFERSEFCISLLCRNNPSNGMDDAEMFACCVGQIAGKYVKFKESVGEKSNSLRDILVYSKYDRDKLRFVLQRVCLGVNLSKAEEEELKDIEVYIKDKLAEMKEIPDAEAHKDYSYFFYKGVFENLG
jgi:hypothetical protein